MGGVRMRRERVGMPSRRIRNSAPAVGANGIAPAGTSPENRIKHEFKAYGDWKKKTLDRRRGTMLRPVVLYRHIRGKAAQWWTRVSLRNNLDARLNGFRLDSPGWEERQPACVGSRPSSH